LHFCSARPSITSGSLLGFFDQDPDDEFEAGIRSLTEAAAHPGAHSTKLWQDAIWSMPPRLRGRFYISDVGATAADRRLQDQGTFRLLVDVPTDETIPEDVHHILGSVYVEYTCRLSKPTIQGNFYGSDDLWTFPEFSVDVTQNVNIIEYIRASAGVPFKITPTLLPGSNGGTTYESGPTGLSDGACFTLASGAWDVRFRLKVSSDTALSNARIIQIAGASSEQEAPSILNIKADELGGYNAMSWFPVYADARWFTLNFRVFIPSGEWRYITFQSQTADPITITDAELNINYALVTPEAKQAMYPTSDAITKRISDLETKIEALTRDESKAVLIETREVPTPRYARVEPSHGPGPLAIAGATDPGAGRAPPVALRSR